MTRETIETALWCDVYRTSHARCEGWSAAEQADGALAAFRKAFPNDPPQTPPVPAPVVPLEHIAQQAARYMKSVEPLCGCEVMNSAEYNVLGKRQGPWRSCSKCAPTPDAPAPSFDDIFNERDKRREEEEAAVFGAFRTPDPEAA